jgi:hypothetical protein
MNALLTLQRIKFNKANKNHCLMLETVKNHMAEFLPVKTLKVVKLNLSNFKKENDNTNDDQIDD